MLATNGSALQCPPNLALPGGANQCARAALHRARRRPDPVHRHRPDDLHVVVDRSTARTATPIANTYVPRGAGAVTRVRVRSGAAAGAAAVRDPRLRRRPVLHDQGASRRSSSRSPTRSTSSRSTSRPAPASVTPTARSTTTSSPWSVDRPGLAAGQRPWHARLHLRRAGQPGARGVPAPGAGHRRLEHRRRDHGRLRGAAPVRLVRRADDRLQPAPGRAGGPDDRVQPDTAGPGPGRYQSSGPTVAPPPQSATVAHRFLQTPPCAPTVRRCGSSARSPPPAKALCDS